MKFALLTSETYNVAIWKQGGACYLFDPKDCDLIGHFSPARLVKAKGKHKVSILTSLINSPQISK